MSKTFVSLLLLLIVSGCQSKRKDDAARVDSRPSASDVPLRVTFVADVQEADLIKRKWLASSSQPIEIKLASPSDLLAMERVRCDVLIYPARMMGELLRRKAIMELPTTLRSREGEQSGAASPPAWQQQAAYNGKQIALSLGCEVPVLVSSQEIRAETDQAVEASWEQVLSRLGESVTVEADAEKIDRQALVDRFLAISATTSNRNPRYGRLFELQTMRPLITSGDFVQAADILTRIAAQTSDGQLALGSHNDAWTLATSSSELRITIASILQLSPEAREVKDGMVSTALPRAIETTSVAEPERSSSRRAEHWNTGGALVASMSDDCSQSSQAAEFIAWLAKAETRIFMSRKVAGVSSSTPTGGLDSLSWKADQGLRNAYLSDELSLEPRLPAAEQYRDALAEGLIKSITGKLSSAAALQTVAEAWEKISLAQDGQKYHYEKSLGLSF